MRNKFICFLNKLEKHFYLFFIIIFICMMAVFSFKYYDFFFVYPEGDYQLLETEINKIVSSNDFGTEYDLNINYTNKNNYLEMTISIEETSVTAKVSNYNEKNQEIIVKRAYDNLWETAWWLPIISILTTMLIFSAFFGILIIGIGILTIINKIKK